MCADFIFIQADTLYDLLYCASQFDSATKMYCESLLSKLLKVLQKRQRGSPDTCVEEHDVLKALTLKSISTFNKEW
jgi:hypothetical protein